jgi:hypothetical protein
VYVPIDLLNGYIGRQTWAQKMLLLRCMSLFVADFVAEVADERGKLRFGVELEA